MSEHRCPLPEGRQPLTISPWTCPECGQVWEASPPIDPENPPIADTVDFLTGDRITTATWVRKGGA